jgi:phage gpG-like protein
LVSFAELPQARVNLGFLDRARVAWSRLDLRPAWKDARPVLRADQREHAKKQAGPEGAWPARSSSTRVRSGNRRRARKMLGRLPTSVSMRGERQRMIMRSPVAWSGAHQEGDRVGHGARIPARPFVYVSDRALEVVAGFVAVLAAKVFR